MLKSRAGTSPAILALVLLSACVPTGRWIPVEGSPETSIGPDKKEAIVDQVGFRLSISGSWMDVSVASAFELHLENKTASGLRLDLDETYFTFETRDHKVDHVSRPENPNDRENLVTILGPGSEYPGRLLGEKTPAPTLDELITIDPGRSAVLILAFKALPKRDSGESYGLLRLVLETEGPKEIVEVRFVTQR